MWEQIEYPDNDGFYAIDGFQIIDEVYIDNYDSEVDEVETEEIVMELVYVTLIGEDIHQVIVLPEGYELPHDALNVRWYRLVMPWEK